LDPNYFDADPSKSKHADPDSGHKLRYLIQSFRENIFWKFFLKVALNHLKREKTHAFAQIRIRIGHKHADPDPYRALTCGSGSVSGIYMRIRIQNTV